MKDIILIGHGAIGANMDTTTCKDPLKGRGIVIIDKPPKETFIFKAPPPPPEIPDLFDAYPGGKAKRRERRKAERSQNKRRFK